MSVSSPACLSLSIGSSMALTPPMTRSSEGLMRKSGYKSPKVGYFDPQIWVSEWRRLHPVKTALTVAAQLGAPLRTVEKWLAGVSLPSIQWVGAILDIYGPGFVARAFRRPPDWIVAAARAERLASMRDEQACLDREIAALEAGARR